MMKEVYTSPKAQIVCFAAQEQVAAKGSSLNFSDFFKIGLNNNIEDV